MMQFTVLPATSEGSIAWAQPARSTTPAAHLQPAAVGWRGRQRRLNLPQLGRQALHDLLGRGTAVAHRLRKPALQCIHLHSIAGQENGWGGQLARAAWVTRSERPCGPRHGFTSVCRPLRPNTAQAEPAATLTWRSTRSSWWHSCTCRRRTASSCSLSTVSCNACGDESVSGRLAPEVARQPAFHHLASPSLPNACHNTSPAAHLPAGQLRRHLPQALQPLAVLLDRRILGRFPARKKRHTQYALAHTWSRDAAGSAAVAHTSAPPAPCTHIITPQRPLTAPAGP